MICKTCGRQISDNSVFCSYCGASVRTCDEAVNAAKEADNHVSKCFYVFHTVGFWLGLCSLIVSIIPFAGYLTWMTSAAGIVFSALGLKARPEKKGLVLSIIAEVTSWLFLFLYFILMFAGIFAIGYFEQGSQFGRF